MQRSEIVMAKITSNSGVVHQRVDAAEGVPRVVHGGLDRGALATDVELHGDGLDGVGGAVDLVAEGFEAIDPPCGGNDLAPGGGEVEAYLPADA